MQMRDADVGAGEGAVLPRGKLGDRRRGQPERAEEPEVLAALAAAASAETAPWVSRISRGTSSSAALTSSAYATTAPRKTSLEPATAVRRPAARPPVHDSAVERVSPRSRQSSSTCAATGRS